MGLTILIAIIKEMVCLYKIFKWKFPGIFGKLRKLSRNLSKGAMKYQPYHLHMSDSDRFQSLYK